MSINPEINFADLQPTYVRAKPFPHIVIDNFFDRNHLQELQNSFPDHDKDFWLKYNNPIEKKLLYNHLDQNMPEKIKRTLIELNDFPFLKSMTALTGIENLISDPELHGGGMHCTKRGGKLDIHIDYSIHPKLKLERRLNLIVYLNEGWKQGFNGELELWNHDAKECIKKIQPLANRAVIFNTDDTSFHGHPDPLNGPHDFSRKSIALYYLTVPREQVTERYRARFVARPEDPKDQAIEDFRRERSGLNTGQQLYDVDGKNLS